MKRHIIILSMLLVAIAGIAQTTNDTINRMVLVESTYNPIIASAVKRNFIPEEVKPTMGKEEIVYADENVPLSNFAREAQPARVAGIIPEKGTLGYAHLGYGNYNNLNGLAAYKWQFGANHSLALKAHVDGWNGNLKCDDDSKWRSHLYDTGLNADYKVSLGKVLLSVGAQAVYYNYNYRSLSDVASDVQQANNLGAYVGIGGPIKEHYRYQAMVSYARFGRSTFCGNAISHNESYIRGEASLDRDFNQWGVLSILLNTDVLDYQGLSDYNGLFSLGITPRWEYTAGDFQFVTGFNMDFLGGEPSARPLQLSPECSISYMPESRFSALLTLDGGRDVHTFSRLYERSPYWASSAQLRPTYTFLNAHLDGGLRIVEGLHLHFGGGYKMLSDALFETVLDMNGTRYTGITNHNAQVVTAGGGLSYNCKDFVSFSAKGNYYHWMLEGDRSLLSRAPHFDIDADVRVRVLPKFHTYTNLKFVAFTGADERAIIDWSLGANYALNKRFSFFLDAHNLLGRRYSYYTGYPSQGFNVLVGAKVKF